MSILTMPICSMAQIGNNSRLGQKTISQQEEKKLFLYQTDITYHKSEDFHDTVSVDFWNQLDSVYSNRHISNGRPHAAYYPLTMSSRTWDQTRFVYRNRTLDHVRKDMSDPFVETSAPWVDVAYAQGATQENTLLSGQFGIEFKEKFRFSMDYDNARDLGNFFNSYLRHNAIGVHWSYRDSLAVNKIGFHYVGNQKAEKVNGGVPSSVDLDSSIYSRRLNAPVNLETGQLNQEDHEFLLEWNRRLSQRDSGQVQNFLDIGIGRENSFRNFGSVDNSDISYFTNYGVDTSKIHYSAHTDQWLGFLKYRHVGRLDYFVQGQYRNLQLQDIRYYDLDGEEKDAAIDPSNYNIFELSAGFKGTWKNFTTRNRFWFGNGLQENEWSFDHLSHFAIGDLAFAKAKFRYESHFLDLNQAYIYQPGITYFDNFTNQKDTYVEPSIGFLKGPYRAEVGINYMSKSNFNYLKADGSLEQANDPVSATSIRAEVSVLPKHIIFENGLHYTLSADDLLPMPKILFYNNIGYHREVFSNKLQVIIALKTQYMKDFRSPYLHDYFNDWTIDTEADIIPQAWQSSIVLSFRVKRFQGTIQYQNLSQELTNKTQNFLSSYSYEEPVFRFGINWMFVN